MAESRNQSTTSGSSLAQRFPFFYGWVILGLAFLAMFSSAPGHTPVISVFVNPMAGDLELSRTVISGIYTGATLTGAACLVIVGRLLDRYGARGMMTSFALALGVTVVLMSFVKNPLHLFVGFAALRLLGQGVSLTCTTLVALWFSRLRARATSIVLIGTAAGLVAVPPLTHLLISALDWRWTWRVLGLIVLSLLVVPAFTLVRRSPDSVGTFPDGTAPRRAMRPGTRVLAAGSQPAPDWSLKEVLRLPSFWLLIVVASLPNLPMNGLIFHQISLLGSRGIDSGVASVSLSMLAVGLVVGTISAGFLADALPNRYIFVGTNAVLAAAILWAMTLSGNWQAVAYGVVLGIAVGGHITVELVILANYYGKTHLGSIRGMTSLFAVGFSALGPLPIGLLHDRTDAYTWPLLLLLAMCVAGGTVATLARPPRQK